LGKILNPILFCLKAQFRLISNLFGERPTFTSWTSTPLVIERIPVWLSDYHCQYHKRYCWALDYTIWNMDIYWPHQQKLAQYVWLHLYK
jgi:hypothetical protein